MPGKRVKKAGKTRDTFGFSLIVVAVVAIAGGYFLGNYFIKMAITPSNAGIVSPTTTTTVTEPVLTTEPEVAKPLPEVAEVSQPSASPAGGLLVKIQDDRFVTPDSPPAGAQPVVSDGLLRVQVGAYNSRPEAMNLAQQLQADGYQTYITTDKPYRVQVGAFADQAAAKSLVDELISDGYSQVVIK